MNKYLKNTVNSTDFTSEPNKHNIPFSMEEIRLKIPFGCSVRILMLGVDH